MPINLGPDDRNYSTEIQKGWQAWKENEAILDDKRLDIVQYVASF